MQQSPTRGRGLLEPLLARMRARQARKFISDTLREGAILDIGCGASAVFLRTTEFATKYGIDRIADRSTAGNVTLDQADLNTDPRLSFEDGSLSVITMLAVVEHLSPAAVSVLLTEAHRTLRDHGKLIITTPAPWTDPLLNVLSRIGMVSSEEIDEHQYMVGRRELARLLERAGFSPDDIDSGHFELGMNVWAVATKTR